MAPKSKTERLLVSKRAGLPADQYPALLAKRFKTQMDSIAQRIRVGDEMEAERGRNTSEALAAAEVDEHRLAALDRLRIPPFKPASKAERLVHLGPRLPTLPAGTYMKNPLDNVPGTVHRIWLDVTPELTTVLGDAAPQWLDSAKAIRMADELVGESTKGPPYHRKASSRTGALLFAVPHILEEPARIASAGVYFVPVYNDVALGVPEGNWYAAAGLDVGIFYPPSVAEVEQELRFQVSVTPPGGGSRYLIAEANQPGLYVDERERGGNELELPLPNIPPSVEYPVLGSLTELLEGYPQGTAIVTYVQLKYWIYTKGQGAVASVTHNLYVLPYLWIITAD